VTEGTSLGGDYMPLRIVRNDIVKMTTDAIVNTANDHVVVGTGCDGAVYRAAGYDELLNYRVCGRRRSLYNSGVWP